MLFDVRLESSKEIKFICLSEHPLTSGFKCHWCTSSNVVIVIRAVQVIWHNRDIHWPKPKLNLSPYEMPMPQNLWIHDLMSGSLDNHSPNSRSSDEKYLYPWMAWQSSVIQNTDDWINVRHFADDISKCVFFSEIFWWFYLPIMGW